MQVESSLADGVFASRLRPGYWLVQHEGRLLLKANGTLHYFRSESYAWRSWKFGV